MNKLNVVIIEDEVPAARLLNSMVMRLRPEWNVTVLPGSVDEAVLWFREHPHPDIIFLDIQLADGNAFRLLSLRLLMISTRFGHLLSTVSIIY